MFAPIVHAEDVAEDSCETEDESQIDCCFSSNMDKSVNISFNFKHNFKHVPPPQNFNQNPFPTKYYKPSLVNKPMPAIKEERTVRLE
ncbi:hypothetical protein HOE67_01475 [Candidatus Peregrinibacteria bacterium]|nr:hypothetical protein [Candidatus Peregrinibacteria bacterium]MBT4055757.1 hypothetical protein [Candidatus Peregrinibacteria bacterium]